MSKSVRIVDEQVATTSEAVLDMGSAASHETKFYLYIHLLPLYPRQSYHSRYHLNAPPP